MAWTMRKSELRALVAELTDKNAELQRENAALKDENAHIFNENCALELMVYELELRQPKRDASGRFTKATS